MTYISRLIGLTLAIVLTSACAAPQPVLRRWNVVLVLVDTLRADHLSTYGYSLPTSPTLDALEGVVFERATAQAACTYPSVNSILTSRYPSAFLGQEGRRMSIVEGVPTLAELLGQQGWATAAVSASWVVRNTPSRVNRFGGFGRGFEQFHEGCEGRPAQCVNRAAIPLLRQLPRPFFLYLHYIDPHNPYQPPDGHVRQLAPSPERGGFVARGQLQPISRMLYLNGPKVDLQENDKQLLRLLYDEEILYFDDLLAKLLNRLRKEQLADDTLLILASDHGEELFDHDHVSHCRDLAYQSVLATPLVMRIPGVAPGRRTGLAQNLDIVPTILDYLGIDASAAGLEGRSLRPVIERDEPVHRFVFAGQGRTRAVRSERYKLLLDLESGEQRLFDLAGDPGETRDVAAQQPQVAEELARALQAWMDRFEGGDADGSRRVREADDMRRELEAVGYL